MVATPPEEIARQHAEACAILSSNSMPCLPRTDYGEIPLRYKQRPTCTVVDDVLVSSSSSLIIGGDDSTPSSTPGTASIPISQCISSRGFVDVMPIVKLISNGVNDPADRFADGVALAAKNTAATVTPIETPIAAAAQMKKNGMQTKMNNWSSNRVDARGNTINSNNNKNGGTESGSNNKSVSSSSSSSSTTTTTTTTSLWNEKNAATNNVSITRPSHDAWGIKKIVLVFCDDFLNTIYTLPWYQKQSSTSSSTSSSERTATATESNDNNDDIGTSMHAAIQPILDVLQISQNQIVRCIFAAMPPGVTIPIHHDTGEWVKFAHRIHVPIIVPDVNAVLFRCGPTTSKLARVDTAPGHVFEMNNQAKHAVTNAHDTLYRVHLILDYVDPSFYTIRLNQNCPVRHVSLSSGEIVTQTRRSIDRTLDAGKRNHPSYIIIGAQKAGTTAIYEYMNQHPWIVRAKRRETHCLDWRWDTTLRSTNERRSHCLSYYHSKDMTPYNSLMTGDSTPSYLLDYYRVIPRLKECFTHTPKLIICVRDPIKRAMSHYAMVTSTDGTSEQLAARGHEWRSKSLTEVVMEDIHNMKEDGLLPYWDITTGTVNDIVYNEFVNSYEEDVAWEKYVTARIPMNTGSYGIVARGLYALQFKQWYRSFNKDTFLVLKLEDMMDDDDDDENNPKIGIEKSGDGEIVEQIGGVQHAVNKVMSHLGLPRFTVLDTTKKNSRNYIDPLVDNNELRDYLQRFFTLHNERFSRMMIEDMGYNEVEWNGVWSY